MALIKIIAAGLVVVAAIFVCQTRTKAQDKCLSPDDAQAIITKISSQQAVTFNKKLAAELLKLRAQTQMVLQSAQADNVKEDERKKRVAALKEKTTPELCRILKQYGWPTAKLVGPEGTAAAFYLLRNAVTFNLQLEMMPIMAAAVKNNDVGRPDFAALVDRIRVAAGVKQLFGTQATVNNGLFILLPIEAEAQVDARRAQFGLPPLATQLRSMEETYHRPVLKAPVAMVNAYSDGVKHEVETSTAGSALGLTAADDEVVRVETNLANLNVSVYDSKSRSYLTTLAQSDFQVFEDGREQTITFFAKTDVPFDLVLLIDVSASTRDKVSLIRKSTTRFIEAARPADRLAIVTFSSLPNVISPLTENRAPLLECVKNIESEGGSNVWDALSFTLRKVLGPKTLERRRAVVFMTDGVDNKLSAFSGPGSEITFADLLETVRRSEALIIPIYLDTEGNNPVARREYETARRTLALLAEESGGVYYKAKKVEDLEGVYEQVIDDLGKVYSLGYRPTNEKRDGSWRTLKLQILNHPDLVPRSRPGYYAN